MYAPLCLDVNRQEIWQVKLLHKNLTLIIVTFFRVQSIPSISITSTSLADPCTEPICKLLPWAGHCWVDSLEMVYSFHWVSMCFWQWEGIHCHPHLHQSWASNPFHSVFKEALFLISLKTWRSIQPIEFIPLYRAMKEPSIFWNGKGYWSIWKKSLRSLENM